MQTPKNSMDILSFDNENYHLKQVLLLSPFADRNLSPRIYAEKPHVQGTEEGGPLALKEGSGDLSIFTLLSPRMVRSKRYQEFRSQGTESPGQISLLVYSKS